MTSGARVFLADKKQLHDDLTGKKVKSEVKVSEKKEGESWSSSLKGLFKVIKWIADYKIYRPFALMPYHVLNGLGHLFGGVLLGRSKSSQSKTYAAIKALHPDYSHEKLTKLAMTSAKYMGQLLLDIIFRMNYVVDTRRKGVSDFGDFDPLRNALKEAKAKGTGVIVVTTHVGQQFHSPYYVFRHPDRFKMDVIASINNLPMWEICNRKGYDNLTIYASTKFRIIKPYLAQNLRKNHLLFIYHDYSSPKQLRAPLWEGKFPYLVHTPQSHISLQKKTGAIILPAIAIPKEPFGTSRYQFLDNTEIMERVTKFKDAPDKIFHGEVSAAINKVLYAHIAQYVHYWEEIQRLWTVRMADKLKLPGNTTMTQFVTEIQAKMESILDKSYESNRPDEQIIALIQEYLPKVLSSLKEGGKFLRPHKTKIMLTGMNAVSELNKLSIILKKELNQKDEVPAAKLCEEFHLKLQSL